MKKVEIPVTIDVMSAAISGLRFDDIIELVIGIDKNIASWDFSLLLLNALIEYNNKVMESETSLTETNDDYKYAIQLYNNVKRMKKLLKAALKMMEEFD